MTDTPELNVWREAIKGPLSWLERWAVHAGYCDGKPFCGCGLELAQYELRAALTRKAPQ